jgi:hypothetical protein
MIGNTVFIKNAARHFFVVSGIIFEELRLTLV